MCVEKRLNYRYPLLTKMGKRQTLRKRFALLIYENTTSKFQLNIKRSCRYQNFGAFLYTPIYCVCHENNKVQNKNNIPHFLFMILDED